MPRRILAAGGGEQQAEPVNLRGGHEGRLSCRIPSPRVQTQGQHRRCVALQVVRVPVHQLPVLLQVLLELLADHLVAALVLKVRCGQDDAYVF